MANPVYRVPLYTKPPAGEDPGVYARGLEDKPVGWIQLPGQNVAFAIKVKSDGTLEARFQALDTGEPDKLREIVRRFETMAGVEEKEALREQAALDACKSDTEREVLGKQYATLRGHYAGLRTAVFAIKSEVLGVSKVGGE